MLVAATAGAVPVEPLTPLSAPSLKGLSGKGLGDGVPRGVLRLVPHGGPGAVGSGLLVCLTARAAANGEKTPIDIADEYYGTHFGDVMGWVQRSIPDPGLI